MMKNLKVIAAKTHPPEYMLHKYWARKPHNVISRFLESLTPDNGIIVDPFCGSGVVLREGSRLGRKVFGFDINPIALLISEVTTNPPKTDKFVNIINNILSSVEDKIKRVFSYNNKEIKYVVHEIIVKCQSCEKNISYGEAKKRGRTYLCPYCESKLRFNLENMVDTRLVSIVLEEGNTVKSIEALKEQKELSDKEIETNIPFAKYNYRFEENRRILAFEGLTTEKLFTRRNFSLLALIAEYFHSLEDESIRKAALLLLTASVAQCSRLIPYRNNMKTGGPAWSVPGFWVPPIHLETNPLSHLRARLEKFKKGLLFLEANPSIGDVSIQKMDAVSGIKKLKEKGIKSDLLFLDPPYGDSVPYLEFSSLWNSFLSDFPDINQDISVSDRKNKNDSWNFYSSKLMELMKEAKDLLNKDGRVLVTFNNNDLKAWESLLRAFQSNGFRCEYVIYQIPAVISSKAQFSPEGSYISDIYSVFVLDDKKELGQSLTPVVNALIKCASSRNGVIARNLALRTCAIAWMEHNISYELLSERDVLINSLFEEKQGKLHLKVPIERSVPLLKDTAREIARNILAKGPCTWEYLYETIAKQTSEIGIPDPDELRVVLENYVIFNKKKCMAYYPNSEQLTFPEDVFQ